MFKMSLSCHSIRISLEISRHLRLTIRRKCLDWELYWCRENYCLWLRRWSATVTPEKGRAMANSVCSYIPNKNLVRRIRLNCFLRQRMLSGTRTNVQSLFIVMFFACLLFQELVNENEKSLLVLAKNLWLKTWRVLFMYDILLSLFYYNFYDHVYLS